VAVVEEVEGVAAGEELAHLVAMLEIPGYYNYSSWYLLRLKVIGHFKSLLDCIHAKDKRLVCIRPTLVRLGLVANLEVP